MILGVIIFEFIFSAPSKCFKSTLPIYESKMSESTYCILDWCVLDRMLIEQQNINSRVACRKVLPDKCGVQMFEVLVSLAAGENGIISCLIF
jgi:hypothetical protein